MDAYLVGLLIVGVACLGAAWVPHLTRGRPISLPMIYVGLGVAIFSLPTGLPDPDPFKYPLLTERLSELVVIISLTGTGLTLDRPVGLKSWGTTWRLLGPAMLLSIAALTLLGWGVMGLPLATAVLLGAALAPTDPVLASEVQALPPHVGEGTKTRKAEVRFALTSEAGLNDGLAFPFTNLAIALAAGGGSARLAEWAWYDLFYKIAVGVTAGVAIGYVLMLLVFRVGDHVAKAGEGIVAIALTLISYAATEALHGYGFVAVFVTAVTVRQFERRHEYHRDLHAFGSDAERILVAVLLLLVGGAAAGGLLRHLTWPAVVVGLAFLLVVRPLAGWVALLGSDVPTKRRLAIAFFGIRGLGSVYYLSHALNEEHFDEAGPLWSAVAFTILASIVIHGATAPPVMRRLEPSPEPPG